MFRSRTDRWFYAFLLILLLAAWAAAQHTSESGGKAMPATEKDQIAVSWQGSTDSAAGMPYARETSGYWYGLSILTGMIGFVVALVADWMIERRRSRTTAGGQSQGG